MATVCRVIVGVHGSLGSLQALRYAADEARQRGVPLVPVIAWVPPGGDMAERLGILPYLRKIWRDAAWERPRRRVTTTASGGLPADLRVEPHVERGETGPGARCRRRRPAGRPAGRSAPAAGACCTGWRRGLVARYGLCPRQAAPVRPPSRRRR